MKSGHQCMNMPSIFVKNSKIHKSLKKAFVRLFKSVSLIENASGYIFNNYYITIGGTWRVLYDVLI